MNPLPQIKTLLVIFMVAGIADIFGEGEARGGRTFELWAPQALEVGLAGDFNGWKAEPMRKGEDGLWRLFSTEAKHGEEYKYLVSWSGAESGVWLNDPRAAWIRNGNSVVYDHGRFDWQGLKHIERLEPAQMFMYELHIGTFYDPDPHDGRAATFYDAATKLRYLRDMGVNVVALMPVAEFFTETSWGYNPQLPFAIEDSYGGPDGFKFFVREAHRNGIRVQVDIVHNHYGSAGEKVTLLDFSNAGNYFYDSSAPIGRTKWGARPNFSEKQVRDYIYDNVRMYIEEYGIDGFRWDSPKDIVGYDSEGMKSVGFPQTINPDGKSLMEEINRMVHREYMTKGVWSISEDSGLLTYGNDGGNGFFEGGGADDFEGSFSGHWQTAFHNDVAGQLKLENGDANLLAERILKDGEGPGWRVVFLDNHDKAGDLNRGIYTDNPRIGQRLSQRLCPDEPRGVKGKKKALLGAVAMFTSGGVPMLFMGQEFGAGGVFSDRKSLNWDELDDAVGMVRAHRDLGAIRSERPWISQKDGSVAKTRIDGGLLSYVKTDEARGNSVAVFLNFSGQDREIDLSGMIEANGWNVLLNTDQRIYDNDFGNVGPMRGNTVSENVVRIGAWSALILEKISSN